VLRVGPWGAKVGGMGIGDFADKAKDLADQHDDKVDQGLDRAGDEAGKRFAGHESQVDGLVDKGKQYTGGGDTTAAPADAPAEGADPAAEVPPQQ
jgi:MT0933-like antitoxin protein